jgi:nitroreductase
MAIRVSRPAARQRPTDPLAAWEVPDYDFPEHGSRAERLAFALRYAVLAPSTRNTQPWRFRIAGEAIEVYADRTRALNTIDPAGRELVMSCGAALFYLRIALRHFGYAAPAELLPNPADPSFLARIELGDWHRPMREEEEEFHAIATRRTHRGRFEASAVPAELVVALQREAALGGTRLRVAADPRLKERLADLIAQADRLQFADHAFRREVATWVRTNHSDAHDGIPGYALGMGDAASVAEPLILRGFDVGRFQATWDHRLADAAPLLVALGTRGDTIGDWIVAGQAMARVLLRAAAGGVHASFLSQPIEVAQMRPLVSEALGMAEAPQLLLRMGYAAQGKATPRRTTDEVVDG